MNRKPFLSLNNVQKIQLVWAILLLLSKGRMLRFILYSSFPGATTELCIILAIVMYVFAACVCLSNNRLAWWTVIIIPASLLCWHLYELGWLSFYNYVNSHRFSASSSSLFSSRIIRRNLFFMIPTICILFLLYENRFELKGILFPKQKAAVANDIQE